MGSLICFRVEMWLGRRRELLLASVLYFVGTCLEVLAGLTGKLVTTYIYIERETLCHQRKRRFLINSVDLLVRPSFFSYLFEAWKAAAGITFLLLGRIIFGTGVGFAMHGAPAYISEMSPPHLRGMLVSI